MSSVEHIPGPPSVLETKVFFLSKLIVFNLSNNQGEVITKNISKGNNSRNQKIKLSAIFVLRG